MEGTIKIVATFKRQFYEKTYQYNVIWSCKA